VNGVSIRIGFGIAAVVALGVSVVFAVVGDGVSTDAGGVVGLIVNHAHTLVWVLLAAALGIAAALGSWQRLSGAVAVIALLTYGVFMATVLFVA
jgi:hypothetical protein